MDWRLAVVASLCALASCQNDTVVKSSLSDKEIRQLMRLEVAEQISYFGYPSETHTVVTDDGYILTLNRVPNGKGQQFDNRRPVILLQHGIFCFSGEFFLTGPGHALGYIFADAGFDVWVMNARGTKYSRRHVSLDPDRHKAFWAYSFHEVGVQDLSKCIDYILGFRKARQLVHVGYSEGTTAYYALMSVRPEYNEKIVVHYGLAPIAYFRHLNNLPLSAAASNADIFKREAEAANVYELSRKGRLFELVFRLCSAPSSRNLCKITMFAVTGFDRQHFDDRLLPLIWTNFPMSSSLQQVLHYSQVIDTGKFRQFDYGLEKNLLVYNASSPPDYDLSRVSARARLVYSCNDMLSTCADVEDLYRLLPNAKRLEIKWKSWNHMDYIWGTGIKPYLADLVLDDLRKFVKF